MSGLVALITVCLDNSLVYALLCAAVLVALIHTVFQLIDHVTNSRALSSSVDTELELSRLIDGVAINQSSSDNSPEGLFSLNSASQESAQVQNVQKGRSSDEDQNAPLSGLVDEKLKQNQSGNSTFYSNKDNSQNDQYRQLETVSRSGGTVSNKCDLSHGNCATAAEARTVNNTKDCGLRTASCDSLLTNHVQEDNVQENNPSLLDQLTRPSDVTDDAPNSAFVGERNSFNKESRDISTNCNGAHDAEKLYVSDASVLNRNCFVCRAEDVKKIDKRRTADVKCGDDVDISLLTRTRAEPTLRGSHEGCEGCDCTGQPMKCGSLFELKRKLEQATEELERSSIRNQSLQER